MKIWLLLIYIAGAHQGGFDAIEFSTETHCESAKTTIVEWANDQVSALFSTPVRATCIEVEK